MKLGRFVQLYAEALCVPTPQGDLPSIKRDVRIDKILLDTVERFYKEGYGFEVCESDRKKLIKYMKRN